MPLSGTPGPPVSTRSSSDMSSGGNSSLFVVLSIFVVVAGAAQVAISKTILPYVTFLLVLKAHVCTCFARLMDAIYAQEKKLKEVTHHLILGVTKMETILLKFFHSIILQEDHPFILTRWEIC